MAMTIHDWPEGSELTIEVVGSLHKPSGHYRISSNSYPRGTSFSGVMRAGRCYVLSGACSVKFGDDSQDISAPSFFDHPAGGYQLTVEGDDALTIVDVWLLPEEFRR